MPQVAVNTNRTLDPLNRFLGSEARILNREVQSVSNCIEVEWVEVALPEDSIAEDEGKLYLSPIDDGKYFMQLCYLEYEEGSSGGAIACALRFLPLFFEQYPAEMLMQHQPFRFDQVTEQQFVICTQSRGLLSQLEKESPAPAFIRSLQHTEAAMHLLRKALDSISAPITDAQVPACRFLAYDSERDKILEAKLIIEQNLDQPHTIRELSRKIAMNECYLKKGFKSLVGKTIHEYQQELRITKAKELLQVSGLSVTDVANTLGYSSISHFSTAFKRVTGIKPCELLA